MDFRQVAASHRWSVLDGKRRSFINRCEKYAGFTLRKLCLPDNYDSNNNELQHDNQAVGAQATNHLANKIMLALFAPSRPFFRLDPSFKLEDEMAKAGITSAQIAEKLALGEKRAIRTMDRLAIRPKLYEAVKHLIVIGNVLIEFTADGIRVIGIKDYVVRRSKSGKILEVIIKDMLEFGELTEDVREAAQRQGLFRQIDAQVTHYRWFKYDPSTDEYKMEQHVENIRLPKTFDGKYPEDKLPIRAMTWDLADKFDYGTGLVEDYNGDFAGLSMLSKAQIEGAILASEFRWLVNPGGQTKPEDLMNSENGAAIPGLQGDITLVQSGKAADLQVMQAINGEYINRIGRGFLLGSAVTRQAERVTAEEIRWQAQELETSLGGAYSRLAVDFQIPMANWLLAKINFEIRGTEIEASIVTGLDALSRGGDLDDLQLFVQDVTALGTIPPEIRALMKVDRIIAAFAAGRRIQSSDYILTPEEQAQAAQQQQQQDMQAQAMEAGVGVAASAAEAQVAQG